MNAPTQASATEIAVLIIAVMAFVSAAYQMGRRHGRDEAAKTLVAQAAIRDGTLTWVPVTVECVKCGSRNMVAPVTKGQP